MSLALFRHASLMGLPTTTSTAPTCRQHQSSLLSSYSYFPLSPFTEVKPYRVCTPSLTVLVPVPQELDQRRSLPLSGVVSAPLDLTQNTPIPKTSPEIDTGIGDNNDDGSGSGIGGGSGGGGGDDDTYHIWGDENFDPEDNKDGNIFQKRKIFAELFDKGSIDAVLSEWMKTAKDLPAFVRAAYDLGLLSSIQFTRFLFLNSWPSVVRFFCRSLPSTTATMNGKLIADPCLPSKLVLEMVSSLTLSVWLDFENRGKDVDAIRKEWDRILMKAISASISNVFLSFWLAPCCLFSYGSNSRFKWLGKLPQNAFERSYKFNKFDVQKRALAFFSKGVCLFVVGFAVKFLSTSTTEYRPVLNKKKKKAHAAFDHGLYLALNANARYQIIWGLDRFLLEYFDVIGVALFFNFAARISNAWIGLNQQN